MTVATRMSCWATAAAVGLAAAVVPLASLTTSEITAADPDLRLGSTWRGAVSFVPVPPAAATPQEMLVDIAQPTASNRQSGSLHLMRWDRGPGVEVIEIDSIRQGNPDGSGLRLQHTSAFERTPPTPTLFAAGELRSLIGEPIPTDPVRLGDAVTAPGGPTSDPADTEQGPRA